MFEHRYLTTYAELNLPMWILSYVVSAESNHSVAGSASSNANICFYFRRGECRFGARCRDIHSKPPPSADRPNQTHTFNFDAPEYIPQRVLQNRATEAEAEPEAEAEAENEVDTDQQSTYAQIVKETQCNSDVNQPPKMCPYFNTSGIQNHGNAMCPYGVTCEYYHGDLCEICGVYCLHPKDEEQQRTHKKVTLSPFCLFILLCWTIKPTNKFFLSKLYRNVWRCWRKTWIMLLVLLAQRIKPAVYVWTLSLIRKLLVNIASAFYPTAIMFSV